MKENRPQVSSLASDSDLLLRDLLEAWAANNRINLSLIAEIGEAGLRSTTSTRGGRDVARQFAHLHNNRINWLTYHAPGFGTGLEIFESKYSPSKDELRAALEASAAALAKFFGHALRSNEPIKGWKRGIFTALAYHIAHESHHRGSILLTLKLTGNKLDQDVQYRIWDWSRL
jgi:uncharacterized damage-inducible protein DinB